MKGYGSQGHQDGAPRRIGRRRLLVGTGAAAAVVGTVGAVGRVKPAAAMELRRAKPAPSPIPGGIDTGPPPGGVGIIHIFLPGPEDAVTPIIGLRGMGLDVEPSTLTDFKGFTAFAVLAGQAKGSDGKTYDVEFDLRVMEGEYKAQDGSHYRGAFAFF
jgi:hypothetical protein